MYVSLVSLQMYNLRADILRKALGSSFHTVPVTLNYGMVVFDYCNSHRLKDSVKALTEAIMIAVDQRKFISSERIFFICVGLFCGKMFSFFCRSCGSLKTAKDGASDERQPHKERFLH